jgi:hypothetical protein
LRDLKQEEENLKSAISEYMPELGWLEVDDDSGASYIIERIKVHAKPKLETTNALKFIRRKFGQDAARIVAEECSTHTTAKSVIYVRRFPRGDGDLNVSQLKSPSVKTDQSDDDSQF